MVRRRQLSGLLRSYRIRSGKSVKEVAERLFESPSKVTRIEKGQRLATQRDIRDLCVIYNLPHETQEQLMDLARGSRERQWWQRANLNPALQVLIGMEGSAKSISEFELILFPGLLQIQEYADAVLKAWMPDAGKRQRAVGVRMQRQALFRLHEPPELRVVIDEAVVRRTIGGPDIMRAQLKHVADLATTADRVDLRVIPFRAGMHVGVNHGFTVLEFENLTTLSEEPPIAGVVYFEANDGDRYLDASDDVAYHLGQFERLRRQALAPDESIDLLRTAAARL